MYGCQDMRVKDEQWDCVTNVTSAKGASKQTSTGDALSTKTSQTLRLKCTPSRLPAPPYPKTECVEPRDLTKETIISLKDFWYQEWIKLWAKSVKNKSKRR